MGYLRRHAIVVSGWQDEAVEAAHEKAVVIFNERTGSFDRPMGQLVSPIINGITNNERSFFIAPDGSKEWWDTSDAGDAARSEFVAWLRKAASEDHFYLEWVEVQFGDDEHQTLIVGHSDEDE